MRGNKNREYGRPFPLFPLFHASRGQLDAVETLWASRSPSLGPDGQNPPLHLCDLGILSCLLSNRLMHTLPIGISLKKKISVKWLIRSQLLESSRETGAAVRIPLAGQLHAEEGSLWTSLGAEALLWAGPLGLCNSRNHAWET